MIPENLKLTAEQIQSNWEQLMGIIEKNISSPRKEKLLKFYDRHATRIATMPASSIESNHSAFAGGYVYHVLNVIKCGLIEYQAWKKCGAMLDDFTKEELVFSLLNHDLGKMGNEDYEYYVPNPSEWHRKNQGKEYEINTLCSYMEVPDRSLFLLQQNGISYSENEFFAIKLHDGMYADSNKSYYVNYHANAKVRTNLVYIVSHADMMASRIEFNEWGFHNLEYMKNNKDIKEDTKEESK